MCFVFILIIESIVPSRNIGCLWVLSTSVYQLLRTLVHSSFYPLPWLPIFSSCFSVYLSSCFPEGYKVGQPLVSLHPFFCVWSIHLNFLFLISKFISSCPVAFHRSLLEIIFGHHILNIYLRHAQCIRTAIFTQYTEESGTRSLQNTDTYLVNYIMPEDHKLGTSMRTSYYTLVHVQ